MGRAFVDMIKLPSQPGPHHRSIFPTLPDQLPKSGGKIGTVNGQTFVFSALPVGFYAMKGGQGDASGKTIVHPGSDNARLKNSPWFAPKRTNVHTIIRKPECCPQG